MALINKLTAIADAIREKTGTTEEMSLDGMAAAIASISTSGGSAGAYELAYGGTIASNLPTSGTSNTVDLSSIIGTDDNTSFVILCSGGGGNNYKGLMLLSYDAETKKVTRNWRDQTGTSYIGGAYSSAKLLSGQLTITYSKAISSMGAYFTAWPVFYLRQQ